MAMSCSFVLSAQPTKPIINANLHGTVIEDKSHEPIPGASVQIKALPVRSY